RAITAEPNNEAFRFYEGDVLLASRALDVLLKANEEGQKQRPADLSLVLQAIDISWLKGDAAGMKSQGEAFLARRNGLAPKLDLNVRLALKARVEAEDQYLKGDFKAAGESMLRFKDSEALFEGEVLSGKYAEAARRLVREQKTNFGNVEPR